MDLQSVGADAAELICTRLGQYFGAEYDISSNQVDVFTIKSRIKPCVYVESEDILIINSIVRDFGLNIEKWRLVAANGQVGLYFVVSSRQGFAREAEIIIGDSKDLGRRPAA